MVRGFKLYFINNQYLKMVATVILSIVRGDDKSLADYHEVEVDGVE